MFITFEGIEGCGKSTQCRLLGEYLEGSGRRVRLTREPGGSELGKTLRAILLDTSTTDLAFAAELFLYLADRAQHMHQLIRPALTCGETVICDRFADSTVVYQGYGRGLDPKQVHAFNDVAVGGRWPDLTLLIDLPVETGLQRALARNLASGETTKEGRFEAEDVAFHTRVREGYLTWAALHRDRIRVVDGTGDRQDVFSRVRQAYLDFAGGR